MNLSKNTSNMVVSFIKNNTSASEEDLIKIQYGVQIIIFNLFKGIILLCTAYLLGVFKYTLLAILFFGILRSFASGVHASSTIECIILNYIIFLGNVYLSINLSVNIVIKSIIFAISLILVLIYAPADTKERPLVSKSLRKSLKIKSTIVVMICYIVTLLIRNNIYGNLIMFAILEGSLVITPLVYKLLGKSYYNYKFYNYS